MRLLALLVEQLCSVVVGADVTDLVTLTKDFALDKPYSRSAETEADEVGLMLMARSGYNPQVAPGLWQKMAKASGGSKGALDVLASTHPSDESRQENLQRLLPEAMELYKAAKNKKWLNKIVKKIDRTLQIKKRASCSLF